MESLRDGLDGNFTDFDSQPLGTTRTISSTPGFTMRTTRDRFGFTRNNPVDLDVIIHELSAGSGDRLVGGIRSEGPLDGQQIWEINFDTPQLYAGLERIFQGGITNFYNDVGTLLATHENPTTGFEFVGYLGNSGDLSTYVSRVEIDGIEASAGLFAAGYGDDLFFGMAVPEPSTYALFVLGLAIVFWRFRVSQKRS